MKGIIRKILKEELDFSFTDEIGGEIEPYVGMVFRVGDVENVLKRIYKIIDVYDDRIKIHQIGGNEFTYPYPP